jgi:glycogen/starch/alpha-glucan phosphorylase-like protein
MENVLHAAAGVETTAVVPASGGGSRAGVGGGRTDLLWRLMAECIADDKETIQREVVRHVEYTLACTRLSFQKKHAFQAVAHSLRDRMVERFNDTEQFFEETGARRLYYLSLEFLMGRALSNGVYCLGLVGAYREALLELGFRLEDLYEEEKDAALGNGGLGRLAACFMDSLATLNYPASGYGLRYSYGLFEQRVMRNEQIELPDCWLTDGNPWEVERLDVQYTIRFYGNVRHMHQPRRDSRESLNGRGGGQAAGGGAYSHSRSRHSHSSFLTHAVSNYSGSPVHSPERDGRAREGGAGNESGCDGGGLREHRAVWEGGDLVQAVAFDTLIPGHGTRNTLNLRLWASRPTRELEVDMTLFNMGDYQGALEARQKSENITSVLYPNDSSDAGKELRLKQQYFLVAATMHDLLARYKKSRRPLIDLAQHVVVQLNDTHPALGIVELLRQLIDEEGLSWHKAWGIVTAVFNYTNHTVLPEALEKWPVTLLDKVLPRHMELIWEINHRFLKLVRTALPLEDALVAAMSIIEEHNEKGEKHADKLVRMAHLAVIGSRRVNGVAEMHTEILKRTVLEDFARLWPSKIMNITNGVTPRRWLFQANPLLTDLINKLVTGASSSPSGNAPFGVAQDFSQITKLRDLVHDSKALEMWRSVRRANKLRLAHLIEELTGTVLDPNMLFDVQVKRIHEYKRQVLNVLGIIHRHTELRRMRRDAPGLLGAVVPRAVIFSGKAAPGYAMAKLLIKLILHVAQVVNADKDTNHFLKVVFIPNYNVKYAEVIIPGADLSQHLSTAGKEASGTSNMKFSMNGCLLLASLDGSTAEICREVGEERVFIFGTRAEWVDEVRQRQHWPDYKVDWRFNNALDRLRGGDFGEPGLWAPLLETLRPANDQFLVGADFGSYLEAQVCCRGMIVQSCADTC